MRRAESRLDETDYSVLLNNCEHFARWCHTGRHESRQVRTALQLAGGACLAAGAVVISVAGIALARNLRDRNAL